MKPGTLIMMVLVASVGLPALVFAQNEPRPVQPGPGGPPGQSGFNQPGPGPGGPGPGGDFGGQGRGGNFGRGGRDGRGRGGEMRPPNQPDLGKFEMLRSYIDVVDRYTAMTRSADSAGVAAVVSATDILRQRGPESAIDFLSKSLPEVKIPAIERAIRIQLADLYRQSGQADKALEQLGVLMKASN